MSVSLRTAALQLLALITLSACNAITGAGEPEIVDGEGGGSNTSGPAATGGSSGAQGTGGGAGGAPADVDPIESGSSLVCGDGVVDPLLEACDDGNVVSGDGCSEACSLECGGGEALRAETATCVSLSQDDDQRTWVEGRSACQAAGGDLVVLHTLDLAFLEGRLLGAAHVGAERAEDGAFEWIDGATVNEAAVIDEGGDCLAVEVTGDQSDPLLLRAVACSERLAFLCERDPVGR